MFLGSSTLNPLLRRRRPPPRFPPPSPLLEPSGRPHHRRARLIPPLQRRLRPLDLRRLRPLLGLPRRSLEVGLRHHRQRALPRLLPRLPPPSPARPRPSHCCHHSQLTPSLNDLLTSCSSLPRLKCIHALTITLGLSHRLALTTKLISLATALTPSMSYAHQLFDAMPLKDSFTWNTLIRGYTEKGPCVQIPILYSHMHGSGLSPDHFTFPFVVLSCTVLSAIREGMQPNEVTLASVLPACNGVEYLYSGRSIHGYVVKTGMETYITLVNALIMMYCKCGKIDHSRSLFDQMPHKSLITWNTMIAAYEQTGAGGEAINIFREMQAENVRCNAVTLVSVVSACAGLGDLITGERAHGFAKHEGLGADVRVGNALIDMYAKCGSLDSARCVFEKLSSRDVVSWSAMIAAYSAQGHAEEAIRLLSEMEGEEIRPNSFTFTSLLTACRHSGCVEEGMWYFDSMTRDYGIAPTLEHCACIVDLLSRVGRLKEAYDFIRRMPVKPDNGVWRALLGGCRIHMDLQLAEFVIKDVFQSEPHNVTFCVLLSNMYADAGRWEDAAKLRKVMKDRELKKIPGHSLLEIERKSS